MNCKPGDLAAVTGSPISGVNGQIVEVISASDPLYIFGLAGVPGWFCTNAGMREQGIRYAPIPDCMLRPISGVPANEKVINEVMA
ncbi:hypothetical protein ACQUFY_08385 [Robbsia andropogonis]|uniref:hypothetical protein n=1 Tax=Robbsia andropogonis TaxID=28092 RepID=UPI003D2487A4